MSYIREPVVKRTEKGKNVYFSIRWSPLKKAEKYAIVRSVPAEAGIYELYYMDKHKRIRRFAFSRVWYGGLRTAIRERTDPILEGDAKRRHILETCDIYYRYSLISSMPDMRDIEFFFAESLLKGQTSVESSGRYEMIYIEEDSPDALHTNY